MTFTLFTATGCARCKIAKRFMDEKGIGYEEQDINGEGKEIFGQFYRANRRAIFRGEEGIEFPVLADGSSIRQGVGVVLAYLHAGTRLDGFIRRSKLSKGWMDGVHVSGGDRAFADDLVRLLGFVKRYGLKLQLATNGKNVSVLEKLLEEEIGDRVIMDLKGPQSLYSRILGEEIDLQEIRRTMELVTKFPESLFETTVAPMFEQKSESDHIRYLTPEEIGDTAKWIKEVITSNKQPYLLRVFDPETSADQRFKSIEKLTPNTLIRYRSAARRHQVLTEVEKN